MKSGSKERSGSVKGMEDNLKKAYLEMLFLFLLNEKDMYISEIATELNMRSKGAISVVFPYSSLSRIEKNGYIEESGKRKAADGRRRQFFRITELGKRYLAELLEFNACFSKGIQDVLALGQSTLTDKTIK